MKRAATGEEERREAPVGRRRRGATPADRDALEARREAVAANAALDATGGTGRRSSKAPTGPWRTSARGSGRGWTRWPPTRVHGVQLDRARAATTDALAQRDATKREADAAVARAIATMKEPSRRPGATPARA